MRGIAVATTNLGLATMFGFFAVANAQNFFVNPRLSVFLIVIAEAIAAVFLVIRHDAGNTWHGWRTWAATFGGSFAPLLLRPIAATEDMLPGEILQVIAFSVQIVALLHLNRSIGLLPAHRGIKSEGIYAWMRHPLYIAYIIMFLGYVINNQSLHNAVVAVAGIAFLVIRIHQEEAFLAQYAEYRRYASRVRWRLIPAIW